MLLPHKSGRRFFMRIKRYHRIEVVAETNPAEFQDKLNALYERLEGIKFTEQLYNNENGFSAYITYEATERTAECLQDEYELSGYMPVCEECPYYQKDSETSGHCAFVRGRLLPTDSTKDCKYFWEYMEQKEMVEMYQKLREEIKSQYRTFGEFCKEAGIEQTYLSAMLHGKRPISMDNKFKILKTLNIELSEKNLIKYFEREGETR